MIQFQKQFVLQCKVYFAAFFFSIQLFSFGAKLDSRENPTFPFAFVSKSFYCCSLHHNFPLFLSRITNFYVENLVPKLYGIFRQADNLLMTYIMINVNIHQTAVKENKPLTLASPRRAVCPALLSDPACNGIDITITR